jgi:hypothetical protein
VPGLERPVNIRKESSNYLNIFSAGQTLMSSPLVPTVFISSTIQEFKYLRGAIASGLRRQGVIVQISEAEVFHIAGDSTAVDECLRNAKDSDIFVLLVGGRAGSKDEHGISITRREYRIAKENSDAVNKPRMLMFLDGEVERGLAGNTEDHSRVGIDDADHSVDLLTELQSTANRSNPHYLKRFESFDGVMDSITSAMNLGHSVQETLMRKQMVAELSRNLANCVTRTRY